MTYFGKGKQAFEAEELRHLGRENNRTIDYDSWEAYGHTRTKTPRRFKGDNRLEA